MIYFFVIFRCKKKLKNPVYSPPSIEPVHEGNVCAPHLLRNNHNFYELIELKKKTEKITKQIIAINDHAINQFYKKYEI